jgi:hypothetical protein
MPWDLAEERRADIEGQKAWPEDLFNFFVDALRDPAIVEADGSHAYFEVLSQYRENLAQSQRDRLVDTVMGRPPAIEPAKVVLNHAAWMANFRLMQSLGCRDAVEKLFRDLFVGGMPNPAELGHVISELQPFSISMPPGSPQATRCHVTTPTCGKWSFVVDVHYSKIKPSQIVNFQREDTIASQINSDNAVAYVDETFRLFTAFDLQLQRETILALPGALAQTQQLWEDHAGWSKPAFEAFLQVAERINVFSRISPQARVEAEERFDCVFGALSRQFNKLNLDQAEAVLEWLASNVNEFEDVDTQEKAAQFVIGHYDGKRARDFFDQLIADANIDSNVPRSQRAKGVARAGLRPGSVSPASRSSFSATGRGSGSVSPARSPSRTGSVPPRLGWGARLGVPPLSPRVVASPESKDTKK